MKKIQISGRQMLMAFSLVSASAAYSISPSYTSSSQTDVQASDSLKLYPEEKQRSEVLKSSKIIFFEGKNTSDASEDETLALMARFYDDQFRHSQDPEAPMFTFMSKDANIAMGIGANLVLSGYFNWNGNIPGPDFCPYNIQIPTLPENKKSLNGSAAGTNLFFSLLGKNSILGNYKVFIQGKFNGYGGKGFKLNKAWIQLRDFTAGLATTTFSDPDSEPDVLDPGGSNGVVSTSNVLVRYMKTFKDTWTVAGSVEFPSSQPDVSDPHVSKMSDYVPDIAAFGQYQWNRGHSHVRLAALMRNMAYRDLRTGKNHHVTGWGALLGSTVKIFSPFSVSLQTSIGQGISAYTGDLSNGDYDLLGRPDRNSLSSDENGLLYAPTTFGLNLGLKYYWMSNLSSNIALGTLRVFAKNGTNDGTYKYGQYLAANVVYNILPRIQVGLEYLAGKRMNFDHTHGAANRLQALFVASF